MWCQWIAFFYWSRLKVSVYRVRMFRFTISPLIFCALIGAGVQAYCCFVLELTSTLYEFPDAYKGHFVRNYTGLEKINDHLFWEKYGEEKTVLFWSKHKEVSFNKWVENWKQAFLQTMSSRTGWLVIPKMIQNLKSFTVMEKITHTALNWWRVVGNG